MFIRTDLSNPLLFSTEVTVEKKQAILDEVCSESFAKRPDLHIANLLLSCSKAEIHHPNSPGLEFVRQIINAYPETSQIGLFFIPEDIREKAWSSLNAEEKMMAFVNMGKTTMFGMIKTPPLDFLLHQNDLSELNWNTDALFSHIQRTQSFDSRWAILFEKYMSDNPVMLNKIQELDPDFNTNEDFTNIVLTPSKAAGFIIYWIKHSSLIIEKEIQIDQRIKDCFYRNHNMKTNIDLGYAIAAKTLNQPIEHAKNIINVFQSMALRDDIQNDKLWALITSISHVAEYNKLEVTL